MENAEYQSMTHRLSASMAKTFIKDKALYDAYYVSKTQSPPDLSDKLPVIIGDCVHQVLLEKKEVVDVVSHYPADCFKSNGAINPKPAGEYRELMAAQGKYVLKDEDFRRVFEICNSVLATPLGDLVTRDDIVFEEPVFWTDQATGIDCRCKPDFLYMGENEVRCYDLKVTDSAAPENWSRIAKRLNYWLQTAHYCSGLSQVHNLPVSFIFWVVEASWPYRIAHYEFDSISMERGATAYSRMLNELKRRTEENDWTEDWEKKPNYLLVEPWDLTQADQELEGFDD
jgi:exodeoxyribonuclease VIII